ncbi:MAG: DNA polymerase III subunit delta [Ilumatobacter sp.]|uniref:DNA polymerase III subunit delta n=1 Tax=Ilumatobacter sp. TaxID=1967498 RepID=UPI002602574B|nr:DNA polymerase III subunit delta [Ilumatobacter sp.]MDJ0767827.1 DNA polymerase III subunit delta [Ilumatobacter sp.]
MAIHLLTGDDESIVRSKAHDLVHELIGDGDRSLMVDEFEGEEYELREVADAAQTMPFLTDRRVVVARDVGRFNSDDLPPILHYLESPLDTTDLVFVSGGGRLAKKLSDAVKAAGGLTVNTNPPNRAKDRQTWVAVEAEEHGVRLDPGAAARIAEQLGEDVGRLDGVLAVLRSTYGDRAKITAGDVEPFLGEAGGVPPWDFTDAIDAGRTAKALMLLGRMIHGGERHPLQIMAILHTHYGRLARLDGVDATNENEAAEAMGIKPGFPAKKALGNYRRLGGGGVQRAIELLARADLDLRGDTDLDSEMVIEVLVARLSRLGSRR